MANFISNPTSLLAFIRNQVSKALYKGINILFHPCCPITISSVDLQCDGVSGSDSIINATITFTEELNFLGKGIYTVTFASTGQTRAFLGNFTDGNSIYLEEIVLPVGDTSIGVNIYLPTNYSGDRGVTVKALAVSDTVPICV